MSIFLWVFTLIFSTLLFLGIFLSFKYRNPYKWIHIVGFPGSGKTTLATKLTQQHLKKGWVVYSNIEIPGAFLLDPADLGKYKQDPKSIIILDEIGLVWDNRKFKEFSDNNRDWAKKHRHHKHKVYSFSQSMDYDSKLRDVTDKLYLLVNYFGWFSAAKEIRMKWTSVQPDANSEGRIAKAMYISPFILAPFGARIYTFIPRWVKYFDSFELPDLPDKEYKKILYPANMKKKFIPKPLRHSNFIQIADSRAPSGSKNPADNNLDFLFGAAETSSPPPGRLKTFEGSSETEEVFKGPATEEILKGSDSLDHILNMDIYMEETRGEQASAASKPNRK